MGNSPTLQSFSWGFKDLWRAEGWWASSIGRLMNPVITSEVSV
jgi:hypothetical protein